VNSGGCAWRITPRANFMLRTRVGALERRERDPYVLWDVYAAMPHGRVHPFLQVTNTSNTSYQEVLGVAMPGRTIVGGVETYQIKATLQGKANLQINRASDGSSLFSEGNASFIGTVTDSGASSGIGQDDYALTVTRSDGTTQFKYVPVTKLGGGNVVVHMK